MRSLPTNARLRQVIRFRTFAISALLACASCSFNSDKTATTATTARGIDGLSGEGEVLVELLRDGADATYHATYQVRRGDTVDATLEVWQRGARSRVDSSTTTGGKVAVFRDKDRTDTCTLEAGTWTCARATTDERGFDGFVDDAVNDLGGRDVVARIDSIAGRDVRCFSVAGEAEVCVTPEGIPARMAAGDSTTELTSLDNNVADAAFQLPAGQ